MHFSLNLRHISDDDIKIFTNDLQKLQDDFCAQFEDIENTKVPAQIVTPFDVNFENLNMKPELQCKHFKLSVDIAAKALFVNRNLGDFWYNKY